MATTWTIDPFHSEIVFKVKHLVISTVTGHFQIYEGQLQSEGDDFAGAKISFAADVNSINTGIAQRDEHLKSDDFFNAASFPQIKFESLKFDKKGEGTFELHGNLTIRDVTKPVTLHVEHGGVAVDPYGNTKAGFEVTGSINRKDFGLKWSATTEAGGLVVGDEVKLAINVQLAKQA